MPTADGWLALVGIPPALRSSFYECIGRPDLSDDPRFQLMLYTAEIKRQLHEILREIFPTRTTAEWCDRLRAAGQRYAPVRDYKEVAADEGTWQNGYLTVMSHPEWGDVTMAGVPIRMSETPLVPGTFLSELGQHTEEVLLELGYDWDEIGALREAGAI